MKKEKKLFLKDIKKISKKKVLTIKMMPMKNHQKTAIQILALMIFNFQLIYNLEKAIILIYNGFFDFISFYFLREL